MHYLNLSKNNLTMELTGIILSGGQSSRMGKEKGLCLLNGKPLIEYSFDLLKKFCDSIIISSNSKDYEYLGCQIINDERDEQTWNPEYQLIPNLAESFSGRRIMGNG